MSAAHEQPARTLEVELTFDVDADTPAPDLCALPGVSAAGEVDARDLDARYLDTADLALAQLGYAVRRRTGGPDEGWHIKGPRRGAGRVELQWPLGDDRGIPAAVRAAIADLTDAPLEPLARIRNSRLARPFLDECGGVVVEFSDDRVHARNERTGGQRRWREWEVELGPAAPTDEAERTLLLGAIDRIVRAAGARTASSQSKLARAVGA